jgi:hypothetical protein
MTVMVDTAVTHLGSLALVQNEFRMMRNPDRSGSHAAIRLPVILNKVKDLDVKPADAQTRLRPINDGGPRVSLDAGVPAFHYSTSRCFAMLSMTGSPWLLF